MTTGIQPTVVIVPGFRDHIPEHWQTLLAERLQQQGRAVHIVPQIDQDKRLRRARVANLERVVSGISGPIIIVAHSAGCVFTAHWAQQTQRAVQGAILAAPVDYDSPLPPGYKDPQTLTEEGWTPIPRQPLKFPSIVIASRNDPVGKFERIRELADAWGSRFIDAGNVGHIGPTDGFGTWSLAEELVQQL
uniref:RBBP9/YdeN family alpha/beta hydrolase n=1 Tax=Cupriavidus yeoncheonensis TaxID=1462994 RepID=UPI003F499332